MIFVRTNIAEVVKVNIDLLKSLSDNDKMVRTAATNVLGLMKTRIHGEGLDASDQRIGTYSKGYMKVRTGNFFNTKKTKTGKTPGKLIDAGVFTKGRHKGEPRPKYNRGVDTKVILSLTRQMELDMKVVPIDKGYGIGYSNSHNFDKSQWCENTYYGKTGSAKGKIFSLSEGEIKETQSVAEKFVNDAISGHNS